MQTNVDYPHTFCSLAPTEITLVPDELPDHIKAPTALHWELCSYTYHPAFYWEPCFRSYSSALLGAVFLQLLFQLFTGSLVSAAAIPALYWEPCFRSCHSSSLLGALFP